MIGTSADEIHSLQNKERARGNKLSQRHRVHRTNQTQTEGLTDKQTHRQTFIHRYTSLFSVVFPSNVFALTKGRRKNENR